MWFSYAPTSTETPSFINYEKMGQRLELEVLIELSEPLYS